MANIVKSVEFFNITVDDTTNSGTLSKSQDTDNCVPFFSGSGGSNLIYGHMMDIYLSSSAGNDYINLERVTTDARKYCRVYLVEFDSNEVKVQQGTFSMSGTTQTVTVSGVDLDRTAMVFYHKGVTSNRGDYNLVRGKFNSSTQIEFSRGASTGTIEGHYYIFEALNEQFSVQHIDWGGGGTWADATLSDPSSMCRGLLISSYYSTYGGIVPGYSLCYTYPITNRLVRWNRHGSSGNIYAASFYIKFEDDKYHAQHKFVAFGTSDASTNIVLERPVNTASSMVMCDNVQGSFRTDYASNNYTNNGFCGTHLTTASGVYVVRNNANVASHGFVQVIDWNGESLSTGSSTPLDPDKTFVKSVEAVEIAFDSSDFLWYKDYELTKGQDVSNCIPLTSLRATHQTEFVDKFVNVWFEEPNLLCVQRISLNDDTTVNVNVVEFYPDQVEVNSGSVLLSTTTNTTTVSGVDLNKTALVFHGTLNVSSSHADYTLVRGSFSSSTEISFYRYTASYTWVGTYFTFEDLKGNFEVESTMSTFGGTSNNIYPTMEMNPGSVFVISSYATSRSDQVPGYTGCYIVHRGTKVLQYYRYSSSYNIYQNTFMIKFTDDKEHVDYVLQIFGSSDKSKTQTLNSRFNSATTTLYSPMDNNICATNYTSNNYVANGFITAKLSGSSIEMKRERANVESRTEIVVIDWIGYSPSAPIVPTTQSFVRSIESFDLVLSGNEYEQIDYLTKGQITSNCVPFFSYNSASSNNTLSETIAAALLFDGNKIVAERYNPIASAGNIGMKVYVVEFNPSRVKIQKGGFVMSGTSLDITIEEVDLDKTFVVAPYYAISTSNRFDVNTMCAKISDTTTLTLSRITAAGALAGQYYVVESLSDDFSVQLIEDTLTGSNTEFFFPEDIPNPSKTFLMATYSAYRTDAAPGYSACRVYKTMRGVTVNRNNTSYNVAVKIYGVEFSPKLDVSVQNFLPSYNTSDTTYETDINKVDDSRSIALSSVLNLNSRVSYTSTNYIPEACTKMEITTSGSKVQATRATTGMNSYSSVQIIEFPEYSKYYFDGTVTELGYPAPGRIVRAYRKDTGYLVDETTSASGTGYFYLETTYSGTHDIVCLDDAAGFSYNDLIYGDVIPTTISGS